MITSVTLGDIAEFIRGVTYKPTDITNANDPVAIACMRTKNIQRDLDDRDLVYIPAAPISVNKRLRAGDILVSSANSWNLVGKCSWIPHLSYGATFGGFTSVLRSQSKKVDARYLYHWFSTERVQQAARSFGQQTTNISNLNHSRCLELVVPLPSLDEQRRITAILDKADALRRKRRHTLSLFDKLRTEVIACAFSEVPLSVPLGELCDVQGGLQVIKYREKIDLKIPYLRVANVYRSRLDLSEIKLMGATEAEISRTALEEGDLLFVEGHGNADEIGRCAIWDGSINPCIHQNHIIRARPTSPKFDSFVICHWLNSQHGKQHLIRRGKTTSGLNTISVSDVRASPVPVLEREHLCAVRSKLLQIATMEKAAMMQSDRISSLFASLQNLAFTGQL